MESIEFHHAENILRPLLYGSYEQLRRSHPLVNPALLPRSAVGRWAPDFKLAWIEGVDLLQERTCWVPFEMVHTDFTLPLPPGSGCFPMTSNGLASGNHLWEAVSHGMSEVIERDAATLFALSSQDERQARRINLATVDAPACRELLAQFARAQVDVAVFDMTSDTELPTFRAIIADTDLNPERPRPLSTGTGCHPSREVALSRALTEAAQSRLTIIAGSRDDLPGERYTVGDDPRPVACPQAGGLRRPGAAPLRGDADLRSGRHRGRRGLARATADGGRRSSRHRGRLDEARGGHPGRARPDSRAGATQRSAGWTPGPRARERQARTP